MLFTGVHGDAALARRRLKSYYSHAAVGTGQAYLLRCQLVDSWGHWSRKCRSARDGGLLHVLRGRSRRRRGHARHFLHYWRGMVALQVLEDIATQRRRHHSLARGMQRLRQRRWVGAAEASMEKLADLRRCRVTFWLWRVHARDSVGRTVLRTMAHMSSSMLIRRALKEWSLRTSVSGAAKMRLQAAAMATLTQLAGVEKLRAGLRALRLHAKVRGDVERLITTRIASHGWKMWRLYYRGVTLLRAIRAFNAMCPPVIDPSVETRRFVVSWRHRVKNAWHKWAGKPVLGYWIQRFAWWRWRARHEADARLDQLARERRELGSCGLLFTMWVRNAKFQKGEDDKRYLSSGWWMERTLSMALAACVTWMRAKIERSRGLDIGSRWAKKHALQLWVDRNQSYEQRSSYAAFMANIGERSAKQLALYAWRDAFGRNEARANHIATCEELKEVYWAGRAFSGWKKHVAQVVKGPDSRENMVRQIVFCRNLYGRRLLRAWAINCLCMHGVRALTEMAMQLHLRTMYFIWRRVYKETKRAHDGPSEVQSMAKDLCRARVLRIWSAHANADGERRDRITAGAAAMKRMRRQHGFQQWLVPYVLVVRVDNHLCEVALRHVRRALQLWTEAMPLMVAQAYGGRTSGLRGSRATATPRRSTASWSTPRAAHAEVEAIATPPTVYTPLKGTPTHSTPRAQRVQMQLSRVEEHSGRFYEPFAVLPRRRRTIALGALAHWRAAAKWLRS